MEELYFDEIVSQIQDAYSNIFLLAIKKKLNIGAIIDTVAQEIDEYKENENGFIPDGAEGLLFLTSVAKMMGYSLFDVIYLSSDEKYRIIQNIIDEIDTSEIEDYSLDEDNTYFIYDYYLEDEDGTEIDYELTFIYGNDDISVTAGAYIDGEYGFESTLIPDSMEIWRGRNEDICRFVIETIEDLMQSGEKETIIDYKDFFIHSDMKACNHKYIKVMATVPVLYKKAVNTVTFEAEYCSECGVYYIPESVYRNKIQSAGLLLCQVTTLDEYKNYKRDLQYGIDLKPQSILNMLGYNTNSKENLSEYERRTILKYAIESGIITKKLTIFYLQSFIKRNSSRRGLENSVEKWKSDLQWLYDFNKKGDIIYGVRRIIKSADELPENIEYDNPFK